MERRHRSGDREHHGTANVSRDRYRRQSAATPRANENYQAYNQDQLKWKSERVLRKLQETEAAQLSGNNDYVRRWLVETDEEANQKISDSGLARQKAPNLVEPRTDTGAGLQHSIVEEALAVVPSRKKRKHHASSDSSLLEVPVRDPPQPLRESGFKTENLARESYSDHHRKKRKRKASVSETSIPSASSKPKQEIFERRPRRKTREDRFESKKSKKESKDNEEKRPRKKREKKGDRKKAAKKAGEDLMRNFSSKKIGQDRLTIRPSHGLGLFKNGRASSPVQRRGIPDLAFSEMDFLQRSSRHMSMKEDKPSSKSREKEKRKAARAQDQISTFFKPSQMPLQPIPLNQGSRAPSAFTRDPGSGSRNSDLMDRNYLSQYKERSHSFHIAEKPTLDFQRSAPASDSLSARVRRSPIAGPQGALSKSSEKAMTYVSWSETPISEGAKSQDLRKRDRTQASPSSESILRSLENTGIFRDTGISMAARRAAVSSHAFEQPVKYDQMRTTGTSTVTTSTLQSPGRVASTDRLKSDGLTSPRQSRRSDLREGMVASDPKDGIPQERDCETKRGQIIIEDFDPSLRWHKTQASDGHGQRIATTARKTDIPEQSKSVSLDRHERAQKARIERPSTTVPQPQSLLARDEPSAKEGLGSHSEANALVEQEQEQQTVISGVVETNSPSDRMKQKSASQDPRQTQLKEPKPLDILSGHHDENDQDIPPLVPTRSELHAPSCTQMLNAEINGEGSFPLNKTLQTIQTNASYLGLPARGFAPGQSLSNSVHQNHHTSSYRRIGREPYFIHELQRQPTPYEPSHNEDHLKRIESQEFDKLPRIDATEVEDFPYINMPSEASFSNFYTTTDNYTDNAQHAYDGFDALDDDHLDAELWNVSPPHVDMGMENYEAEELGQPFYQEDLVAEQSQRQQLFVHDYSHSEEEVVYEQYNLLRDDGEQEFWHPHRQY